KQDRIVWWLRWFRLAILDDMQKDLPDQGLGMETPAQPQQKPPLTLLTQPGQPPAPQAEQPDPDQQWQAKLRQAYKNELKAMAGRSPGPWSVRPLHWFTGSTHGRFQHLMSLPVAKIQNTVWDKQTPDALVTALEGYEAEWQEQTKGLLKPDLNPREQKTEEVQELQESFDDITAKIEALEAEKAEGKDVQGQIDLARADRARVEKEFNEKNTPEVDTVILQFQDGWAWWKLSRAYCSEEARAMGH